MTSRGDVNPDIVVRFAPSPNGLLHMGHAYAAIIAHDYVRNHALNSAGRFLLRIEDIDTGRSKVEFVQAIFDDLHWLGLDWDDEAIFQSDRFDSYAIAVERLKAMGMLYPCFCTRSSMRALHAREQPEEGPDGPIYASTCRHLTAEEVIPRMKNEAFCWRLNVEKADKAAGQLIWHDEFRGEQTADPVALGDVVIVPKETPISYHLAVTIDDARDSITHVVRGSDLFASTHIHRLLQALLNLPTPHYVHHMILLDETGQKLSKSIESASLSVLRGNGEDGQRLAVALRQNKFPVGITLSKD